MSDPKLTDVIWITSRLTRPPMENTLSWAVAHAVKQIAAAIRRGTYPHHLEVSRSSRTYGKLRADRIESIFMSDERLQRMAHEAVRAEVLYIPPGWDLDPLGDWIAHVAAEDPRLWDKIPRMDFAELDRRQRAWHLGLAEEKVGIAAEAEVLHRYADGWTWQHLRTKDQRRDEGRAMGHCVGSVSFDGLADTSAVFSLRDAAGRSVATVLMHGTWVAQCYGPGNAEPVPETARRVEDLRFHAGDNLDGGIVAWTPDGEWPKGQQPPVPPPPTEETEEQREMRLDF